MEFNRYSTLQQPLRINPLTVEDLSLVPLAREKAIATGMGVTSSIDTEYNVDEKDLNSINSLIEGIDLRKNILVDDIASNGVTSQTVGEVLKLRNDRNKLYKNVIDQAEQNKIKIQDWNKNIDKMTLAGRWSPQFGELVRETEYSKWKGTVEDGEFVDSYGTKYIDIDKDIHETLSNIAPTASPEELSKLKFEYKYGRIMVTQPVSTKKLGNTAKIQTAVDDLIRTYSDPETERGAFAKYTKLDKKELANRLNVVKNKYISEDVLRKGGGVSFMNIPQPKITTGLNQGLTQSNTVTKLTKTFKNKFKRSKSETGANWETFLDVLTSFKSPGSFGIGTGVSLIQTINKIKQGGSPELKHKRLKENINLFNQLKKGDVLYTLLNNGLITEKQIKSADKSNPAALTSIVDAAIKQIDKAANVSAVVNVVSQDYKDSRYGSIIPKKNNKKAVTQIGRDLVAFDSIQAWELDGTPLTTKEAKSLGYDLQENGSAEGILPGGSMAATNTDNEYIPAMSRAVLVINNITKKRYFVSNPVIDQGKNNMQHMITSEGFIASINPGEVKLGYLLQGNRYEGTGGNVVKAKFYRSSDTNEYTLNNPTGIIIELEDGSMHNFDETQIGYSWPANK